VQKVNSKAIIVIMFENKKKESLLS